MPESPFDPDLVARLERENTELVGLVATLTHRVEELEARLRMNSQNSSKPPSSDGYAKPSPKSRRRRSGKKPGKQPGDAGSHLAQRSDPDERQTHTPQHCGTCGNDLSGMEVTGVHRRQVFDLPPVSLLCIEHRAERKRCPCGAETTAKFPAEATAPTCYGPALRAYVCYLATRQHIPVARVAELMRDTYGAPVSTGTIVAMVQEGGTMLGEFLSTVTDLLRAADVVHADETGLRVQASLKWVHSVSTTELTAYHLNAKRGKLAMDAMGILEYLRGVLVHDGWASYRHYTNVEHALCNAHHLRELDAVAETSGQDWAQRMTALLCDTWQLVLDAKANGHGGLDADQLTATTGRYRTIITAGHAANPPPPPSGRRGRTTQSKALNLLLRLDVHAADVLRFAHDFSVPFDNNTAERDVRMVKIAQKISGGFRSVEGAQAFLAFRSYLSTAAKQSVNRLDALQRLFNGNTWMPYSSPAGP